MYYSQDTTCLGIPVLDWIFLPEAASKTTWVLAIFRPWSGCCTTTPSSYNHSKQLIGKECKTLLCHFFLFNTGEFKTSVGSEGNHCRSLESRIQADFLVKNHTKLLIIPSSSQVRYKSQEVISYRRFFSTWKPYSRLFCLDHSELCNFVFRIPFSDFFLKSEWLFLKKLGPIFLFFKPLKYEPQRWSNEE